MSSHYVPRFSRRTTLQWMAAGSLLAGLPHGKLVAAPDELGSPPTSKGYGTDPDLKDPKVTWSLIMTPHQLEQTAVLADLILPGSAHSPAPSAVGVTDFINEWVSAPYPDQVQDRAVILEGLAWIDDEAKRRGRQGFLESDGRLRAQIVDEVFQKMPAPSSATQTRFMQRLRYLTVGAYYTTPEGLNEIGYIGNVAAASYAPITDVERQILDGALAKLGLLQT
jgi:Gluconate 2-dehydrogenase subunit 3